jgi:dienelactone hydrolase
MSSNEQSVRVPAGGATLEGNLAIPDGAAGVVLFAHGSGSSRHSPRNRYVAQVLQQAGLATLLVDLLTADEEQIDNRTGRLRFDIGLLASRLVSATDWLSEQQGIGGHQDGARIGILGRARAAALRWWRLPSARKELGRWSRGVAGPIWQERLWHGCRHLLFLSWAATTSR